jgi:mono/diheme cytochrome c family protein
MFTKTLLKGLRFAAACAAAGFVLAGCDDAQPVRGFVLPEGDIDRGRQVFLDQGCHQCHTIQSIELPERPEHAPITLQLGGKVYRVKDYGELLDAIVNPDHIISPKYLMTLEKEDRKGATTPMPNFNEDLTVAELIDLVAFLHAQYSKMDPQYYRGYSRIR